MSDATAQTSDGHPPTVFISHKLENREAAEKVARHLCKATADLEVFVAGNSNFRGANFGARVAEDIANWLGRSDVVLLIFTSEDEDWSWCMWEAGVATDPYMPDRTKTIIISLSGAAPSVYRGHYIVAASDQEAMRKFTFDFCCAEDFFPRLGRSLTRRTKEFTDDIADQLHVDLKSEAVPRLVKRRWLGFTLHVLGKEAERFRETYRAGSEDHDDALVRFMKHAELRRCDAQAARHFDLTDTDAVGKTLFYLRERWVGKRLQRDVPVARNRTWDRVIADEVWRICDGGLPRLTWDPFLGLDGNVWLYPLILTSTWNPDRSLDFEVVLIETREPGAAFPGE